jgi:long-subunit acyl-CoA synthetase (AMP-forming)
MIRTRHHQTNRWEEGAFTPERGELTVSLKLKRDVIYQRHAAELEPLYRADAS